MTTDIKTLTVRLPDDLWRVLEQIANDNRRSLNAQIVYMLEQALKDNRPE